MPARPFMPVAPPVTRPLAAPPVTMPVAPAPPVMAPAAPPQRPAPAALAPPPPAAPAPLPPQAPSIAGLRASQAAITAPNLAPLRTPPAPALPPLPVPPAPPPAAAGVGAIRTPAPAPAAPAAPEPRKTGPLRPVNPFLVQDPRQKARRLARALISDMLVYHPEKRQQGIRDGTLPQLFRDEIEKSWLEYVEQVGKEMAETTPFWTDALNEILAGGKKLF
jgi:hypothetical protein